MWPRSWGPRRVTGGVGGGQDLFRHAQSPGLENSLTPLANGMFQLHRKESGGSCLQQGGQKGNRRATHNLYTPTAGEGRWLCAPKGGHGGTQALKGAPRVSSNPWPCPALLCSSSLSLDLEESQAHQRKKRDLHTGRSLP